MASYWFSKTQSWSRKAVFKLCLYPGQILATFITQVFTLCVQVEGVPTVGETSRRLPTWIDGLWKKIRYSYDGASGDSEYVGR